MLPPPRSGREAPDATYSDAFFRSQQEGSLRSAAIVVPILVELFAPRRVLDVGCGVGGWLSVFQSHGVEQVMGVDGGSPEPDQLMIPPERFVSCDLRERFPVPDGFDLVLCLEVAEHLPASSAAHLVAELTARAPVVVFSAAIPHQGGTHHINERWQSYWAERFERSGFAACDCLRPRVWDDPGIEYWYAQNMLAFVDRREAARFPELDLAAERDGWPPLDAIHPRLYAAQHDPDERLSVRAAGRRLLRDARLLGDALLHGRP